VADRVDGHLSLDLRAPGPRVEIPRAPPCYSGPRVNARLLLRIVVGAAVALRLVQRILARKRARLLASTPRGLTCPSCGEARLVATATLALPGDASAGAIDLEALSCRRCAFRGVAVRTDRPASHLGYPMLSLSLPRDPPQPPSRLVRPPS
jgi:hypothetical protein